MCFLSGSHKVEQGGGKYPAQFCLHPPPSNQPHHLQKSGDLSVRGFVIESEFFENHPGTYFFTINSKGYENVKTSGSFTIPAGQQEDIQINMDPSVFET